MQKGRPPQLTLSPSDSALRRTAQAIPGTPDMDEDRGVMSEVRDLFSCCMESRKLISCRHQGEAPNSATPNTMRRRLFGRSQDSSEFSKRASDPSSLSILKDNSPLSSKTSPTDRDGASSITSRHSRGKRSVDNAKPSSDRLSLFGSAFGGPLGKTRKPAPRYPSYVSISSI
jgi:hypothetical protein